MSKVKSIAMQQLISLAEQNIKTKHPSIPHHCLPKQKYSDKTANGLTKCIVDYINFIGGMAERTGNTGRYIHGNSYKNVFGKEVQLTKGKYIPGTGRNGTADIHGILSGKPLAIEVKLGKDKQSKQQKEYQKDFETAGGVYIIAKSFDQFYNELKERGLHG